MFIYSVGNPDEGVLFGHRTDMVCMLGGGVMYADSGRLSASGEETRRSCGFLKVEDETLYYVLAKRLSQYLTDEQDHVDRRLSQYDDGEQGFSA